MTLMKTPEEKVASGKIIAVAAAGIIAVCGIALAIVLANVSNDNHDYSYEYSEEFDGITITDYKGTATELLIPDEIKGRDVMEIGESAFFDCKNVTTVSLPDGIEEIEACAFKNCTALTTINIPDSVEQIDGYAFSGCTGLTEITIPDSVTTIDGRAFDGCDNITITYRGQQYTAEEFNREF
ncbi:MAG: leucine-rich repeat domain-containing protein [Ruminococcus sp.]|nr:leucine-rich repeat domain-containing protein [Ruminococcus sp.]